MEDDGWASWIDGEKLCEGYGSVRKDASMDSATHELIQHVEHGSDEDNDDKDAQDGTQCPEDVEDAHDDGCA